jgi:long-chain acyl-CoA synthetase
MLYECWRQVSRRHGTECALWDTGSSRRWTFRELAVAVENSERGKGEVVYPHGQGPEFILTLLRAWRDQAMVCPLEQNQEAISVPSPGSPFCHLKMTSATTGIARMIAFAPEQLVADAENIVTTMGLVPDSPNLGVISMAHSYGFSNLVLPLVLHGIPLILTASPFPEVVRRALRDHPHVTLPAVPALWRAWSDAGILRQGLVRLAISAGAPLQTSLEAKVYQDSGLKIHNFYGSSECGGIAYDTSESPRHSDELAGMPMRNVRVEIGEQGCLVVRSKAVGTTYWPIPDASLGDGCFRTSDLADILDERVYLRGRIGDQINVAGRKLSPCDIERALACHPDVTDCLVFGAPSQDEVRKEIIVACLAARGAHDPERFKQHLLKFLPGWQVPREWWFVEALGTNERGKMPRGEWRRRYLERKAAHP